MTPVELRALLDQVRDGSLDPAEAQGQVGNVCFAEGLVAFNGQWRLYVGLADSRLGVSTAPMALSDDRSASPQKC